MVVPMKRNEQESNGEIMTARDVAVYLKVSVGAVRRWTRDGKLRGHRLGGGGDWRYLKKDVVNFLHGTN